MLEITFNEYYIPRLDIAISVPVFWTWISNKVYTLLTILCPKTNLTITEFESGCNLSLVINCTTAVSQHGQHAHKEVWPRVGNWLKDRP